MAVRIAALSLVRSTSTPATLANEITPTLTSAGTRLRNSATAALIIGIPELAFIEPLVSTTRKTARRMVVAASTVAAVVAPATVTCSDAGSTTRSPVVARRVRTPARVLPS